MLSRFFQLPLRSLFIVILFIAQWHILFVRLDNDRIKNVIGSDGSGYYEYLPKTLIKKDYPFALPLLGNPKPAPKPEDIRSITGGPVNKYFFGEALALLPFFITADLLTQNLRPDMRDGYSSYYQISVSIAALFYLLIGLWMMDRLLKRMNYSREVINLLLLLVLLGTNLFYYAFQEPSMSHVYSFAFVAMFLDQLHLQLEQVRPYRWVVLALLLSWIVLIRPVNGLIVLAVLPLSGSFKGLTQFVRSAFDRPLYVLLALAMPFLFIGIQSIFYYLQAGQWWVDSYGKEGFDFSKPEISNVLFSFRKGLFIYTPLLFLIFPGIWYYAKREGAFTAISWVALFAIYIYVISSWWYWAYGGSFGMRPVIDFYPFILLPIAALVGKAFTRYFNFRALYLIVGLGMFFNLLQVWQYVQSILPYEGMNSARYAHIFLQTQRHFRFIYPAEYSEGPFSSYTSQPIATFNGSPKGDVVQTIGNKEGSVKMLDFVAGSFKELLNDSIVPSCWLEISGSFKMEDATSDASFITSIQNESCWFWDRKFLIQSIDSDDEWREISLKIDLPAIPNANDRFTVSLMNERKTLVEAKNVKIRLLSK